MGKKFAFLPAALGAIRGTPEATDKFLTLEGPKYANPIVSLWNERAVGHPDQRALLSKLRVEAGRRTHRPAGEAMSS